MHHAIVDGKALTDFMLSWAEIAKGIPISLHPFLDRSILSPRKPPQIIFPHHEYETKVRTKKSIPLQNQEPYMYRSFCFKPQKLIQLKKAANFGQLIRPATTFEVMMALAWIFQTKANNKLKPNDTTKLLIAVDGRPKFGQSFPKGYFGNVLGFGCAESKASELLQKPFSSVVRIIQESIKAVTKDTIRSAIDLYETKRVALESENSYVCSKWTRVAFYNPDFGWGRPAQIAPAFLGNDFMVTVAQGIDSENIILTLGLPRSTMEIFQKLMLLELSR